jgi:DNA-binding HxlR family transcriptional regulator
VSRRDTSRRDTSRRDDESPLAAALDRVGDRWTLLVVEAMLEGPRRFADLATVIPGIAPNILSQRLKHLEQQTLLVSRPYSRRPVRLAYELTAAGLELAGALRMLGQWGASVSGRTAANLPRHASCGTPMEARWYCPTCARAVDEDERPEIRFV